MKILVKIAWRNLKEHKVKTGIIGLLIAVGIMVLVVGNSLMDTATQGIERSYIQNFTGHLMISGYHQGNLTMFGFQDLMAFEQGIPVLRGYEPLLEYLQSRPYVEAVSPQATGNGFVSIGDDAQAVLQLFGIDPRLYQEAFPENVELLEGRFLEPGEKGIVLSQATARRLSRQLGEPLRPGDNLLITSMSVQAGVRIREVPVVGIFAFRQSNPQLDRVSLLDIANMRALAGLSLTAVSPAELSAEEQRILSSSGDDIFGEPLDLLVDVEARALSDDDLLSILGPAGQGIPAAEDSGAWHFLLVRLTDDRQIRRATADLEAFFAEQDIDAKIGTWLTAAGITAEMSYGVRWVFNAIVIIIAIVAIIIIMNTLVISVTERMGEIGTMRAIGAQKSFVRRMIVMETSMISVLFGSLGALAGTVVLLILNARGIEATNVFFEVIFGGPVLYPVLSWRAVGVSMGVVLLIAILASLYPASIVMKTDPAKAMQDQ